MFLVNCPVKLSVFWFHLLIVSMKGFGISIYYGMVERMEGCLLVLWLIRMLKLLIKLYLGGFVVAG